MNKLKNITIFLAIIIQSSVLAQTEQSSDFPISGPNCHDTALRELKLKETRRYIHNHEMKRYLNERCVVTTQDDSKQLGIIELVDTGEPMHGFVSLGDGNVLTKDGVLKRTLPRVTTFSNMNTIHSKAIISNCRQKNIKPCEIKVKYYNCRDVDISLLKVENVFSDLTATRYSFYNLNLRSQFNELVEAEDFTIDCEKKKDELQSMVLAFSLANMSSRTREEQTKGKAFFNKHLGYLTNLRCN
jgi:hypothetical protein